MNIVVEVYTCTLIFWYYLFIFLIRNKTFQMIIYSESFFYTYLKYISKQ